jgi:hypothetical protein
MATKVIGGVNKFYRNTNTPRCRTNPFVWFSLRLRNTLKLATVLTLNPQESRKDFLLERFEKAGAMSSNVVNDQFWRHDTKPIELWSNKVIDEKINYIHQNPVEEGLVFKAEDYVYSSAIDYAGEKGLLDDVIVVK